MVLIGYVSEPTSVIILNTELTNTTILRTDTFPYGTVPYFQSNFQYGNSPLHPDTVQYGTNLKASDIVPLLSDTVPFTFIKGFKSPKLVYSPKTFRKKYSKTNRIPLYL